MPVTVIIKESRTLGPEGQVWLNAFGLEWPPRIAGGEEKGESK
jgi:hypothetical protein